MSHLTYLLCVLAAMQLAATLAWVLQAKRRNR
jgi:hypothetical protein